MIYDLTRRTGGGGGGETYYQRPYDGSYYKADMEIPSTATIGWVSSGYKNCAEIKSFICHAAPASAWQFSETFRGCTSLETVVLARCPATPNGGNVNTFTGCSSLKSVQLGSIGYPISSMANVSNFFSGCTQSDLVITIYVDAAELASVPANVSTKMPQGATNATIIYRSSTTGDILT